MVLKILVLLIACLICVTAMAGADELLPPAITPEELDQQMIRPDGDLSFQQAINLTLLNNPELASYAWAIRSKEVAQIEAGLRPNPQVEIELEDFAGSGDIGVFRSAETTISLSRVIELGDKRKKRRQLASTDHDLARWDYEVKRVDLLSQTAVAFKDVLAKQEKLTIANEINELADEVYQSIKKRTEAGKVSPLEEIKARVELSKTRLSQMNAERQLTISKQRLVSGWGDTEITFNRVLGDFYNIPRLPNLTAIINKLNNNPNIARWATEVNRHQNAINLARSDTIPNISVSAGLRHFNESDDIAAVASISMPLFISNNRKTGIQQSEIELNRASKEQVATETRLRSTLVVAYQRLSTLYQEVTTLRSETVPGAEEVFNAATKTYRLGKLNLLSLLDAQRTYFETRRQYIDVLTAYHQVVVAVERLIGSSLDGRNDYIAQEAIR